MMGRSDFGFLCIQFTLLVFLDLSFAKPLLPDVLEGDGNAGVVYYNGRSTTQGSQYQYNVETVVKFFFENNPPNGYVTCLGYGNAPDIVYGHSSCYNMSGRSNCSMCLRQCYDDIRQVAPLTVGSAHWINESERGYLCRLKFEPNSFNVSLLGVIGPNGSAPPVPTPIAPAPSLPVTLGSSGGNNRGLVRGLVGGGIGFAFLVIVAGCVVWRFRILTKFFRPSHDTADLEESFEGSSVFKYEDLSVATDNFSEKNKLGQGGFGIVYKASLQDGTQVAVKKLSLQSKQGKNEFVNEIIIIRSIQHRNLVRLKGYCMDRRGRILVYEFCSNGSLDRILFSSSIILSWQSRYQIAVEVARGLAYLHEESQVQIIHRDIKASNILLDDKFHPKISDFGISKLFEDKDATSTKVAGTLGYMAPEYVTRGRLTFKTDVFSYGILVLEIVSGRKCMDPTLPAEEELLLQRMWNLYQRRRIEECVDKMLGYDYLQEEVSRLVHIALLCTQDEEDARPAMSSVVAMLLGYLPIEPLQSKGPPYFGRTAISSFTTSTSVPSITSITEVTAR